MQYAAPSGGKTRAEKKVLSGFRNDVRDDQYEAGARRSVINQKFTC